MALKKRHRGSAGINVIANFFGRGWTALLGVIFVPIYAHMIGIESQGIIGLFASLQLVLRILDQGLSATLNRELARASHLSADWNESRDLVRTMEVIYWGLAVVIASVVALLAPFLAHHWLKAEHLSPDIIVTAAVLLGVQMAVQFPQSLYDGGLMGLERQVLLNGISSAVNLARYAGVFLPLWLFKADLLTFVQWQVLVLLTGTLVTRGFLWHSLKPEKSHRPRFRADLLRRVGGFTLGVSATALVSLPLTLADKLLLSHILPLASYGYYMIAYQGAMGMSVLVGPFYRAYLPRFSSLAARDDGDAELGRVYQVSCQCLAAVLAPAAAAATIFALPLVGLWLHQHDGAAVILVATIFIPLMGGNFFNGLMNLPYALTLAKGRTRFGFYQNLIAAAVFLPMLYVFTDLWGAKGAAYCWCLLNFGYVILSAPLLHRQMLPGRFGQWFKFSVLLPTGIAATVFGLAWAVLPSTLSALAQLPVIMLAGVMALLATVFLLPGLEFCRKKLRRSEVI